jgi:hypothetical protein
LLFAFAAILIIVAIVIVVIPLIEAGGVDRGTGITAVGFAIGGIVVAILTVLFVKPGTVVNRS